VRRLIFVTASCAVLLSGVPALAADTRGAGNDDPWEPLNRKIYAFNEGLDRAILRPAAMAYKRIAPAPFRRVLRNFLNNLGEPKVIANDILQIRPARAGEATGRFLVNSVFGIGGLFDVATAIDLPGHENGFSITLGHYGVPQGPYIMIPIGGPSTVRGVVGSVADGAADPRYWIRYPHKTEISLGLGILHGLDLRAENDSALKSLTADATDPYATIRSAYLQNQQSLVDGDTNKVQALPDFDDTSPAAKPAAPAPTPPGPDEQKPKTDAPSPEAAPANPPPATTSTPADSPAPAAN
jgi:phospholipid-binding lipoprotein MlaA